MSRYVYEIMNPELLSFPPDHPAGMALRDLVRLGINGAPVVDGDGRAVGIVSLRDLSQSEPESAVRQCMTAPAVAIPPGASVLDAARLIGRTGLHHLVVADAEGTAVGIVSTLDVIRALAAMPVTHPAGFPHFDAKTAQVWSDPADLTVDAVMDQVPELPGVFVLLHDPPGTPAVVVWAEAVENLSGRLLDLVSTKQSPALNQFLGFRNLRFRVAVVAGEERQHRLLERLRDTARTLFTPANAVPAEP